MNYIKAILERIIFSKRPEIVGRNEAVRRMLVMAGVNPKCMCDLGPTCRHTH